MSESFTVLEEKELPDLHARGVWLKHNRTGLQVFHLVCDDEENLFAFSFRTPPEDSTGIAHVLEHSVLCGSEKYPLKDPFVRLLNQSVNTFLNAMTFPDKTVFPASSLVPADYFNLMDVYGDAVFFPRLTEEVFAQEAHRLEIDADGRRSIQGVVYNEMKGSYSSFESVAADAVVHNVMPGSLYALDSGGDPLDIPSLTRAQLIAFHDTYYVPANCLLFLYGNIPTETQCDWLESHLLNRLAAGTKPAVIRNTAEVFDKPRVCRTTGPASDDADGKSTVMLSSRAVYRPDALQTMECVFLGELLWGCDSSPLAQALLKCGLGEDIAPSTGLESEMDSIVMSCGLRGVADKDISAVHGVILDTLESLCSKGAAAADVAGAVMSVDFANREIKRAGEPYSLTLMRRSLRGWLYGRKPWEMLEIRSAFELIKKRIASEPSYIPDLIRRIFLENNQRVLTVVTPDARFTMQRDAAEQAVIKSQFSAVSEDSVRKSMDDLRAFQQYRETPEEAACLPHLRPSELPVRADCIPVEKETVPSAGGDIRLFTCSENTNGVVYVNVGFPADVLEPADYPYLPLFASVVTSMGWTGKNWVETAALVGSECGSLAVSTFTSSSVGLSGAEYTGRDWVFFRLKMLVEKSESALKLLSDCISKADFSDTKRLRDLALEYRNDFDASLVPGGTGYAESRASCLLSRSKAVEEVWNGLTQLFAAHTIAGSDMSVIAERFALLLKKLRSGGAVIHVTAENEELPHLKKLLADFASSAGLVPLAEKRPASDDDFFALTAVGSETPAGLHTLRDESFIAPMQVGFAAAAFRASPYGTKECVQDTVFAHWLKNTVLWEQIRTVGGAYGVYALPDPVEKTFSIASYRDPKPYQSAGAFVRVLQDAAGTEFSDETLERAVTGTYSREIEPRSPAGRGFTGFLRELCGITDELRTQKIDWMLHLTKADMTEASVRLAGQVQTARICILTDKSIKQAGQIVRLPV